MKVNLSFYKSISKLKLPKSYTGKIFLIAFIGTHIPLLTLFIYLIFVLPVEQRVSILLVLLVATLIGTGATLYFIYRLLAPVMLTNHAVKQYREEKTLPELPLNYQDEAGVLMADTQKCLEQLDDLLKLKNRLIGMVSHDSKTPIGSIKIASGLIKEELNDESVNLDEVKKYLELIEVSAQSHAEFLDNMLTLARFDEGQIPVNKTKVDPEHFFEKLKENHQVYLKTKNISFNTESMLNNGDAIYCDKDKMMAVMNNLVQNSLKFTKEGGEISVKIDKNNQNYLISVIDNGIGIPDNQKKNLFDAFSNSNKGTKNELGSGLGLWIVKVFTELNGGNISFESEVNEGSEFNIYLPLN